MAGAGPCTFVRTIERSGHSWVERIELTRTLGRLAHWVIILLVRTHKLRRFGHAHCGTDRLTQICDRWVARA